MTCEVCSQWIAKTERQWKNRMANMASAPDIDVAPCYICGKKDWATARPPRSPSERGQWQVAAWGISLLIGTAMFVYGVIDGDGLVAVGGIALAVAGLLLTQEKGSAE